jgi:glycosyltransferase involved in cell wall biosynthesis
MTAIIIPAHNEAAVTGQTLQGLLRQVGEGDEMIVVCNGCSDDIAGVARHFDPRVTALETDVPSKTNALNLGDRRARSFPRVYLDADVVLGEGALAEIVRVLKSGR